MSETLAKVWIPKIELEPDNFWIKINPDAEWVAEDLAHQHAKESLFPQDLPAEIHVKTKDHLYIVTVDVKTRLVHEFYVSKTEFHPAGETENV